MHKLAVAFFYTCAVLSIAVTALVFIGKASAEGGLTRAQCSSSSEPKPSILSSMPFWRSDHQ
jgi:hypothetical protein